MKNDKFAYVAFGEQPTLVCAYGKTTKDALKQLAKLVDKVMDEDSILIGINAHLDDDGYQYLTATVSTAVL